MAFDGIVTRAITHELNQALASGRIMKIYQPTETELLFIIRSSGKNHSLLLSSHPSYARFHVTSETYQNPKEPPMFCMLLRKHLVGSFLEKIEQHENERIVLFHFRGKNEIGDETRKTIIVELMGKHSNIHLIDQEKGHILDSIKHIPPSQNRFRTIMPGQEYKYPPDHGKINPLTIDEDTFIKKLDFNSGKLDKQIVNQFMGFSPLISTEIIYRSGLGSIDNYKQAFKDIQSAILDHAYEPQIIQSKKEIFYVVSLSSIEGSKIRFDTTSEMLDKFYSGKAERDRVKQQAGDLLRFLKNERDKNERKIKKHEQTIVKSERAAEYQRYGELLTANMHALKFGDKEATVIDYYDPEQKEITIHLNPNKSPSENAQAYFKTYQKLKKSKQMVEQEITKAKQEINYMDELIQQIEGAREQDINEIREELQEEGYLKARANKKNKRNKPTKPQPETFYASDGTLLLVGKNNKQNEYLTNRLAARDDIWLHTKNIPGSHVVIRDSNPSEKTLMEGAELAAYFSKSKNSSSVPVDYTSIRHVRKPSGAKPGFVTYENQKTIFVTPNEETIKALRKNKNKEE
ncbi:Rqc2 family fibronectin-binding protein [Aquibacillus albus]|uniref:Rqc2 homolog RqcH n=1 Tax=Aquibacillus albus TaxID=1168171 RepID=A0ABS2N0W7_9BACI|nr:NFACT RNA binding domain-containing protein [Aquibacillus albus]MBM7571765.1 putative ribosome quality control (RQC) complex YloA/Tae2 family protein [Aquibacillus albus]